MKNKLAIHGGKKVRKFPYKRQQLIDTNEIKAVGKVLKKGELSGFLASPGNKFFGGENVLKLEKVYKKKYKVKYSIAIQSATAGLHTAIAALDLEPGDEVIVTPYSMIATATAILMHNCVPVFADVEMTNYNICPISIKKKITKKTKAIMLTHLFGYPADMRQIMKIAKKYNLYVIEDCAQAPEGKYKNRLVGTFGDIGIFSFNQNKTITTGEGGMIITNNKNLAKRSGFIRNHGEVVVDQYNEKNISGLIGYNYRMTEIEAAIGIEQHKKLKKLNNLRINNANYLTDKLRKYEKLFFLPSSGCNLCNGICKSRHVYFVYPFRLKRKNILGIHRDLFVKAVQAEGLPLYGGYVRPIYYEPMYQKKIAYGKKGFPFKSKYNKNKQNYEKGICPNCEDLHHNLLMTTPIIGYPNSKKEIDQFISGLDKVLKNINDLKK